jgi:GT2 family glycosyltransferase
MASVPAMTILPVYVVHWNAPDWVKSTTDAFLASTVATRVTVIDNGPAGVSLTLDERVKIVSTGGNLGYAGGANVGVADWLDGDAEFCVIACHDVTLEPDGLERLVTTAVDLGEYGVVAPEPGPNVASGAVLAATARIVDVAWASGACLLLRRGLVEDIGPFDAEFGSYGEDVDLCYRARAAGWKVGFVPGVRAGSAGSVNPGFRTQMYVNQVRLRAKHAGIPKAAKMLVAFLVLAAADAVRWLVRRDPVLLRRAGGRVRAVPGATRILWDRMRTRS